MFAGSIHFHMAVQTPIVQHILSIPEWLTFSWWMKSLMRFMMQVSVPTRISDSCLTQNGQKSVEYWGYQMRQKKWSESFWFWIMRLSGPWWCTLYWIKEVAKSSISRHYLNSLDRAISIKFSISTGNIILFNVEFSRVRPLIERQARQAAQNDCHQRYSINAALIFPWNELPRRKQRGITVMPDLETVS